MAKCKNCKKLDHILNRGISVGRWCVEKSDSPDIERERSCDKYVPMTNADRIRSMTDEELAEFLLSDDYYIDCTNCKEPESEYGLCIGKCENELVRWLKSEVGCE